ncbi:hypothetical protein SNEBB_009925 [Seison nebaliae]|nr:hypothetical protein SNEBB_009925 [Seison nebaliae]
MDIFCRQLLNITKTFHDYISKKQLSKLWELYEKNRAGFFGSDNNNQYRCNDQYSMTKQPCNFSTNYTPWYCEKLRNGNCGNLSKVVQNEAILSDLFKKNEIKLFNKLFESIPKKEKSLYKSTVFYEKNTAFIIKCSKYFSGKHLSDIFPSLLTTSFLTDSLTEITTFVNDVNSLGYYVNGVWFWYDCRPNFSNISALMNIIRKKGNLAMEKNIIEKIRNKNIFIIGDSTSRQWLENIYKIFNTGSWLHVSGKWYEERSFRDSYHYNFLFSWRAHGMPFRTGSFHATRLFKDVEYHLDQIMNHYKQSKTIPTHIIINYDVHLINFNKRFYHERAMSIGKKIAQFLHFVPNIKILYKGTGKLPRTTIAYEILNQFGFTQFTKQALSLNNEMGQYYNFIMLREITTRIYDKPYADRFIFIPSYGITQYPCNLEVHPCKAVVDQQLIQIIQFL